MLKKDINMGLTVRRVHGWDGTQTRRQLTMLNQCRKDIWKQVIQHRIWGWTKTTSKGKGWVVLWMIPLLPIQAIQALWRTLEGQEILFIMYMFTHCLMVSSMRRLEYLQIGRVKAHSRTNRFIGLEEELTFNHHLISRNPKVNLKWWTN